MSVLSEDQAIILIVDDSTANLQVLSDFLYQDGFKVWSARDGETAIQLVKDAQPDLILLDVMMPGIDGFETCRRLKKTPQTADIPIIFASSLTDTVDKVKGFNLGAVDYITKPFQKEEIIARLKLHLRLRTLTKTLETQNIRLTQEISERSAAEAALQKLTEELEERVQERTAQLSTSLQELQQAQFHLVQSEKMSTLGQLMAGVAHEINNPIGCMAGNLLHACGYTKDLLRLLQLYREKFPEPGEQIQRETEAIDLEYLIEDLPKLMSSMRESTERISKISTSLRTFSRADMATKVSFNIHEGLNSTLMILKHRLKANEHRPEIRIIQNYSPLPVIKCYPGQINQVFMNIIANAIDAIDEESQQHTWHESVQPAITIQTNFLEECHRVAIRIQDNGPGMSEAIQAQAFEHLFTTKAVGVGTGLGLSISRQIVENKHGGQLICISELGKGSEFIIEIPIEAKEAEIN